MIAVLLLLQTIGEHVGRASDSFDLAAVPKRTPAPCGQTTGSEIVVCARQRQPAPYRAATPTEVELLLPKAEFGLIGKARMSLDGEHAKVGGFDTNRAMVRVKVPF